MFSTGTRTDLSGVAGPKAVKQLLDVPTPELRRAARARVAEHPKDAKWFRGSEGFTRQELGRQYIRAVKGRFYGKPPPRGVESGSDYDSCEVLCTVAQNPMLHVAPSFQMSGIKILAYLACCAHRIGALCPHVRAGRRAFLHKRRQLLLLLLSGLRLSGLPSRRCWRQRKRQTNASAWSVRLKMQQGSAGVRTNRL